MVTVKVLPVSLEQTSAVSEYRLSTAMVPLHLFQKLFDDAQAQPCASLLASDLSLGEGFKNSRQE